MIESFIYCLSFGGVAGLLAGLFGIGGGVVLVPFFVWLFSLQGFDHAVLMVIGVATSLATIILTSISSVVAHQRLGTIRWDRVIRLAPGIFGGSVAGAMIADYLSSDILRFVFVCFLIYVGVQMAVGFTEQTAERKMSGIVCGIAGLAIGVFSAFLGIGGGSLTVPLMAYYGLPMRNAVAVSSACGVPIAVSGTVSYILLGWDKTNLQDGFLGYIYLPAFLGIIITSIAFAPLGAKLAYHLPTRRLKRLFSILVFVVAIRLLW